MSPDLVLKPMCSRCGSTTDLYGSNCKHMTLCTSCGKIMAENHAKCYECGTTVTRLIREYPVRASSSSDKNHFIGRFVSGLPNFSKKKNADIKWSLKKSPQGRQVTDSSREKFKNKPWVLDDETGQFQYQGQLEGGQSATYYLLMLQGKEFNAISAGSWYNFNKIPQYKQLTLEEAEEKIKNRKKTADGYERWMMKSAKDGPAAFGEGGKFDDQDSGVVGGGKRRRKTGDDDDAEENVSDKGDDDDDDELFGKSRRGLNKSGGNDDEEDTKGDDHDFDDDDIEKGDDWEHEEIFTDDDEAVGIDPEEREDLGPEIPPPPEIKDDVDDEEGEDNEEEGGLSKSGKELKKLLGRSAGVNESEEEDDDDDMEEDNLSPVLAPKKKEPKEEPLDNSPAKLGTSGSAKGTPPSSKSSKGKRKLNGDDVKSGLSGAANSALPKKIKTENGQESKPTVKELNGGSKSSVPAKGTPLSSSKTGVAASSSVGPVTEEEIRAVLLQKAPVTTQDLVAKFKSRLKCSEEKTAFGDILKRISKIKKTNGANYIVLRET